MLEREFLGWTIEEELEFEALCSESTSAEDEAWWDEFDADVAEHLRLLASQEGDKNDT